VKSVGGRGWRRRRRRKEREGYLALKNNAAQNVLFFSRRYATVYKRTK
jgi:hypothetical protein